MFNLQPSITSFSGDYAFLSNFYPSPIWIERKLYRTVEHAYQAHKTFDAIWHDAIRHAETPGKAKRWGNKVVLRPDWETVKIPLMLSLLRLKFSTFRTLENQLLLTQKALLIEGNTWGDRFWGCVQEEGQWVGENHLGRLLMQVREEIWHPPEVS